MTTYTTQIDEKTAALMAPDSKIGVLATQDGEGMPHLTFITSIQALGPDKVSFGKFCTGLSKTNIEQRPDAAFLALNTAMEWVRGNARFTHKENTGPLFDEYNNKPLFRYNSYCGFNQVYVMDLVRVSSIQKLAMPKIVAGALVSRIFGGQKESSAQKLKSFGHELLSKIDSLKFISWQGEDGLLQIVPVIQGTAQGTDRIVFSGIPYGSELTIPNGQKAAFLCLNLQMQSVEVEGTCSKKGAVHVLDIERVYNSMMPKTEYIYPRPERPLAVTEF